MGTESFCCKVYAPPSGWMMMFVQDGAAPGDGAQVCLQRARLRLQLCQQVEEKRTSQKNIWTLFTFWSIRYKLEEHASQHHKKHLETNRNNVCQICSQGFTRPENLKKHRVRPHTFHCELCVKSFIAVDRLERHCLNEHRCLDLHSHLLYLG